MNVKPDSIALLPPDAPIDLMDLVMRFMRRLPIFLVVATLVMGGVIAYTMTRTPIYKAVASIVIEPRQAQIIKTSPVISDLPPDSPAIDTEVRLLNSEELATRVARRLQLQNDPEFNGTRGKRPAGAPAPTPDELFKQTVKSVQDRIDVKRAGVTFVIDVGFLSESPVKAARIANTLVEEYISGQVSSDTDAILSASRWLNGRLATLQVELQANEAAVQQYKIANNLMSTAGTTMAEQEVSTLNQQIASAGADVAEKRARYDAARQQISRGGGGGDVAAVRDSDIIRDLRSRESEVTVRKADLETRYGPLHPEVKKATEQQAQINTQIQTEISRVLSGLQAEVSISEQRYQALLNSRGRAEGSLGSNTRAQVTLAELQRKADASRAVYETFLNRAKETSAQEGLTRADARISTRAQPPEKPASPKKTTNYALGLLAAIALGLGGVILVETMDGALRTARDVESRLKVANLAGIPALFKAKAGAKNLYVVERPLSVFAEAFRNLKKSVWAVTPTKTKRIIVMTSALPNEGKTLSTLSFGRSLARSGVRTLIVDTDLRRRMLTKAIGGPPPLAGLVELLSQRASLKQVITEDAPSGAYLLLLSDAELPSEDLFEDEMVEALFAQLRVHFDAVVLDTAPVLAIADTRTLASHADATVLLVRWAKTPAQAARAALDILATSGAFVAGVALTQVDLAKQSYFGYGDNNFYHNSFKKYYSEK